MKIGLITSRGGHLFQVYQLAEWWRRYDHFWVTGQGGDSDYMLKGERVYYGHFPESRNIGNAIKNLVLAVQVLRKEQPDVLFSCGAGIAPPVFLVGKLMGCKLIFMEPYDFTSHPSLSGRLVARLVDRLLVQHKCQKDFFKRAEYWGATL